MDRMPEQERDIVRFLQKNIEPLQGDYRGVAYRASVFLIDGTFLPCVVFYSAKLLVEQAIRRFEETRSDKRPFCGYHDIVKSFVARGNCINPYDISKVEKSRFAFPVPILSQIRGETHMSWTGFVVKMKDGKCFSFGTTFLMEFFNMPEEYDVEDITEIINHSYVAENGEVQSYHAKDGKAGFIYRERPFFECYLDEL